MKEVVTEGTINAILNQETADAAITNADSTATDATPTTKQNVESRNRQRNAGKQQHHHDRNN